MTPERRAEHLSPVQRRFVEEYPQDFNGAAAYMRASTSTSRKSAATQASKLMKMPKIRAAIEAFVEASIGPSQKRLKENVEYWESVRDDEDVSPAIRMRASENLAKFSQMFVEKKEVEHSGAVQIIDDIKA